MRILHDGKVPIKTWAQKVEEGAMKQAINLANLPFAFKHIALMPDVHEGYGMPIGGVLAAKGVLIPNAVGVDIGCGLTGVKTDIKVISTGQVRQIMGKAREVIPVGFKHHKKPQTWEGFEKAPDIGVIRQELNSARQQLGTLGSGNHFCSIESGDDGYIWLMIHSGSRNIGLKVASFYNNLAKTLEQHVPREYDLASLPLDSREGSEYFAAMSFCLNFAGANRDLIMSSFYEAFATVTGSQRILQSVKIHHNYAALETHFGKEVVIHRKGAISARNGQLGIIPGSMGTSSYIVEGLGNPESFMSCSHGAGRAMSRREANRVITETTANRAMQGVVFDRWHGDFSEAPMAYKDIEEVMINQADLAKPLVRLSPLGVMKG